MSENVFRLEESKVIARYRKMLSDSADREARYAALADTLAGQVTALQEELRSVREAQAVTADGTVKQPAS